ncbi:MAG TPA: hypothetical protein VHB72_01255 [Candidatus Saccharimonadales bacterium]|nr:hypothetical protein [Candidatus Saccharimonadales bacterium]
MKSMELKQKLRSKKAIIPVVVALALAGCGGESHGESTKTSAGPTPAKTLNPNKSGQAPAGGKIGYDVSYPNKTNLPKPGAFAIVGLNGINAATFNPYFKRQMAWAEKSTGDTGSPQVPKVSIYVHTANPGPTVPDWPTTGKNAAGTCNGDNSPACAYQYGENLAQNDIAHEGDTNVDTVWLDVEGTEDGYTWQKSKASNATVLEGMTQGFENHGDTVGIYSGTYDYNLTIGGVKETGGLTGLPNWILGATTLHDAKANCHPQLGFTGKIVMAQIAGPTLDKNITC